MRHVIVLGLALLAAASTGCGSSHDGGAEVPVDRLDDELIVTYCHLLLTCRTGGNDVNAIRLLLGDEARCRRSLGRLLGSGDLADLQRAVADGTVTYDGAAARACLDSVGSSCAAIDSHSNPATGCEGVFTGTVPVDGACWRSEECAGGSFCDHGPTESSCPGTCKPKLPAGSPCLFDDSECAGSGAGTPACRFDDASGDARCVMVVTQADASAGQPCGTLSERGDTVTRRSCEPGLWCAPAGAAMGTCRQPIPAGEACADSGDVCAQGAMCNGGSCQTATIVREAGGACDDGLTGFCDPFSRLRCVSGACQLVGDGTEGSTCSTGDFSELGCNEGLACHGDTETCGAPRAAGEACMSSSECTSGDCDHDTSTCRARYCG